MTLIFFMWDAETRVWKAACNIEPSYDHCAVAVAAASKSTLG